MPDDGSDAASSSSSPADDTLHAQAVRFLTSIRRHSLDASEESQRAFLRGKGLSDDAIAAAFKDAERPPSLAAGDAPATTLAPSDDPTAAFDAAARAFDDPIHAPPPPALPARSYPRSPLALYYDGAQESASPAPRDRYQVLLDYFRTLTWLLTLGGGVAGVLVLAYRVYVLPRLVTTLNARAYLLKHHHKLWNHLAASVRSLGRASIAPQPRATGRTAPAKNKPKRVQFADEVDGGKLEQSQGDGEEGKATQKDGKEADEPASETTAILPGTDVAVPVSKEKDASQGKEGGAGEVRGEGEEDAADNTDEKLVLPPVDVTEPLRASLARLRATLQEAQGASVSARTPSVADAGGATDGGDDNDEEDDELELDPFALPVRPRTSHTSSTSSGGGAPALHSALQSLNRSVQARHIRAQARASHSTYSGLASSVRFGAPSWQDEDRAAETLSGDGDEGDHLANLAAQAAQVKAEIRSLKGVLLSRRNFYGSPSTVGAGTPPPA